MGDFVFAIRNRRIGAHEILAFPKHLSDEPHPAPAHLSAALRSVLLPGLGFDLDHRPDIQAHMDREIDLGQILQIDITVVAEFCRVFAKQRHQPDRPLQDHARENLVVERLRFEGGA